MAKVFKSYKEESRKNWGTTVPEDSGMNMDQINTGCFLRMADSMEAMAKNHVKLQEDYSYMKDRRDYYRSEYEKQARQIRALKGVITKLKKKGVHHA